MAKNSFWYDASRGGAIVGLVGVGCSLLGMAISSIAFVASLINFAATVYLLFYFTRRRAMLYTEEGFTYAQSLGYIIAMAIFAGIVSGAYQIVASNFLFTEAFEESLNTTLSTLKQTGVYDSAMMDQMSGMMRSYIFSPIPSLLSNIVGNVFLFGFYGLFISIGTKREPDIFEEETTEEE